MGGFPAYPRYPHVNIWGISIWGSKTIKVIVTLLHFQLKSANNKGWGEGGGSVVLISSISEFLFIWISYFKFVVSRKACRFSLTIIIN